MNKAKGTLILILIFVLGVLCGSVATYNVNKYRTMKLLKTGPEVVKNMIAEYFMEELKLDGRQKTLFQNIVKETDAQLREAVREIKPRIDTIIAESNKKIVAILTPEQHQKFERFEKERRGRLEERKSN